MFKNYDKEIDMLAENQRTLHEEHRKLYENQRELQKDILDQLESISAIAQVQVGHKEAIIFLLKGGNDPKELIKLLSSLRDIETKVQRK